MGWLNKIFKGSSYKDHYHSRHRGDRDYEEPRHSNASSGFDKEDIDCAIALSLSVEDLKGKKVIVAESEPEEEDVQCIKSDSDSDDEPVAEPYVESQVDDYERHAVAEPDVESQVDEYERHAVAEPDVESQLDEDEKRAIAQLEEEERQRRAKAQLEEDEQLAKAIQESLIIESPPRYDSGNMFQPFPFLFPSTYRICAGCNAEIGHGRYLSCMGATWHPECFRCHVCHQPITDVEFSMSGNRPYHKHCYKEQNHPKCDVCHNFIPTNSAGLIEYRAHPFWLQKYCPSHERDRTPRCCSCERMQSRDATYLSLDDGRKLCLECLDSAIMDTDECQPLYLEIQDFYEGLNMKIEQQVPLLLVERSALNEAMEGEKNGHHHLPETRGLCLSEEQTISTVSRRPRLAGSRFIDMITEPYRLIRRCEVTAILILFGLPRLLTGTILAHEMMHAWLRLKGYPNLKPEVEEGICQVMAHLWLDSEIYSISGSNTASSSSSSSSSSPSLSSSTSSKKGKRSDFEKELGKFFKHQIESDSSSAYGDGFREGMKAVNQFGLRRTLDHIKLTGCYP